MLLSLRRTQLIDFVQWYRKNHKAPPNFTAMSKDGLLKGSGRKGGVPPRKKKKVKPPKKFIERTPLSKSEATSAVGQTAPTSALSLPPPLLNFGPVNTSPSLTVHGNVNLGSSTSGVFSPSTVSFLSQSLTSPLLAPCKPCPPLLSGNASATTSSPVTSHPFKLCFVRGNIRVCAGCMNSYTQVSLPPNDLCVQHMEWRQFTPLGSVVRKFKFANAYYHPQLSCITLRWPNFCPQDFQIPPETAVLITAQHWGYRAQEFGVRPG